MADTMIMVVPGLNVRLIESGDSELIITAHVFTDMLNRPVASRDASTVVSVVEWRGFLKLLARHPAFAEAFTDEFKQS